MKIKCKINILGKIEMLVLIKPYGLKNALDDDCYVLSRDYHDIDHETNGYNLIVGNEYICYGSMYYNNKIRFLVIDENHFIPRWFPSELFEIVDSSLPYNWYCNSFSSDSSVGWIIGFKELANDYNYLLDLIQEIPSAITIFNEAKNNLEYLK